jgi:Domain of unknown function (DUF397)
MSEYDTSGAKWITSRACNNSACVQVAHLAGGMVAIRDSKDVTKPAHVFESAEWDAFVAGVKAGEFDLPLA